MPPKQTSTIIDSSSLESGIHRYAGDVNLMSMRLVFTDEQSLATRPNNCQKQQAPSSTFILSKRDDDHRWFIGPERDELGLEELGYRLHLIREPWSCGKPGRAAGSLGLKKAAMSPLTTTAAIATDTMTHNDAGELKKREDEDLKVASGRALAEATRSSEMKMMMMMMMSTNGTVEDLAGAVSTDVGRQNRVLSGESSKRQRAHYWKYNATVTSAIDGNNGISLASTLARKLPHEMRNHQSLSLHSDHNCYQADRAAHQAHADGCIAETVDTRRNLDKQNTFCCIDVAGGKLKIEENDCELRDWYQRWLLNGKRDLGLLVSEWDRAKRCQSDDHHQTVKIDSGDEPLSAPRVSSMSDDCSGAGCARDGLLSTAAPASLSSSTASTALASPLDGEQQISGWSRTTLLSAKNDSKDGEGENSAPNRLHSTADGGILGVNIDRLEMISDLGSWVNPESEKLIPAVSEIKATGLSACSAGERLYILMEKHAPSESFIPRTGPLAATISSSANVGATRAARDASGTKVQELHAGKLMDGAILMDGEPQSDLSSSAARTSVGYGGGVGGGENKAKNGIDKPDGANTSQQDSARAPSSATTVDDQKSISIVVEAESNGSNLIIDTDRQAKREKEDSVRMQQRHQLRRHQQPALTTDCWLSNRRQQQQQQALGDGNNGKVVCLAVIVIDVLSGSIQLKPDLNRLISVNFAAGGHNGDKPLAERLQAAALSRTPLSLESLALIPEPRRNEHDDHYGAEPADKSCSAPARAELHPADADGKTATSGKLARNLVTPPSALLYRLELGQPAGELEAARLEAACMIKQVLDELRAPTSQEHEQPKPIVAGKTALPALERLTAAPADSAISLRFDLHFASDFPKDCRNLYAKYKLKLIDHDCGRVYMIDDSGKRTPLCLKDDTLNDDKDDEGDDEDGDDDEQQVAAVADDENTSLATSKPISRKRPGINVDGSALKLAQMTHSQSYGDNLAERSDVGGENQQPGKSNAKQAADSHQQLLEDGDDCVAGEAAKDDDDDTTTTTATACDTMLVLEGSTITSRPDSRGRFHFACSEQLVFEFDGSPSSRRRHDRSFLSQRKEHFVDVTTTTATTISDRSDDMQLASNSRTEDCKADNSWLAQSQAQQQLNHQRQPLGARSITDMDDAERLSGRPANLDQAAESKVDGSLDEMARDSIAADNGRLADKSTQSGQDVLERRRCGALLLMFELYSSDFYRDTLQGWTQLTLPLDSLADDADASSSRRPVIADKVKLPVIRAELSSTIDRLRHYLVGELPGSIPPVSSFVTSQQRYMSHTIQSGHLVLDYELTCQCTSGDPVVYGHLSSDFYGRITGASQAAFKGGASFAREHLHCDTKLQQSGLETGTNIPSSVAQTDLDTQKVIEAYGRARERLDELTKNNSARRTVSLNPAA